MSDKAQKLLNKVLVDANAVHHNSHSFETLLEQQELMLGKQPAKFELSKEGMLDTSAAYIVRQQLELDGKQTLNLASFVTTYIDPMALDLCRENLTKNLADNDEYPSLIKIHSRCVGILGNMWNKSPNEEVIGSATTGSSEAIQLGGLAMKKRWEDARIAAGKPIDNPNVVYPANAHVSIEKFARYWNIEPRVLDVHADTQFGPSLDALREAVDENTVGVFIVQGSTYTGHFVDVASMAKVLDQVEKETGNDVPIHVDGASGGFVAPFVFPELEWDFRIPRVKSINTSGHKFGLAPVGLGWIIFRDRKYLPEEFQFSLAYLGGSELTFTLNFSRPGHPVIAQYYLFLKEGFEGYRKKHEIALKNARILSVALENLGDFELLTDIHRTKGTYYCNDVSPQSTTSIDKPATHFNPGLPVVAFRFSKQFREKHPEVPLEALSYMLRYHGYIIPCYNMPPAEKETEVIRVVVNPGLTVDLISSLVLDISKSADRLASLNQEGKLSKASLDLTFNVLSAITVADNEESETDKNWTHAPC